MTRTVSAVVFDDTEARNWALAIDNMLDCVERGKPLHRIDLIRLRALRKALNPEPDRIAGRDFTDEYIRS